MKNLQGGMGIPLVKNTLQERDYNALVMEVLGPTLEDLFNFCEKRFTVKTILMLVDQMLGRLEFVHIKSYLHRDVKVSSFLIIDLGN